ncbi:hypothetical protein Q31b_52790 [Novipirellula aureliae]|uniref:Uncharacterized protein n=1 Tax=Novipirellula aureliae TaxID=2527966 RepID=A0A5C6DF23_9BACT|nr:hypothetical protein Q31b_52790 [Novipirellula aureliae]
MTLRKHAGLLTVSCSAIRRRVDTVDVIGLVPSVYWIATSFRKRLGIGLVSNVYSMTTLFGKRYVTEGDEVRTGTPTE